MLPSEYAKRNCGFTFEEDYVGCEMMKLDWCNLGDVAIWGSDYPHPEGLAEPLRYRDKLEGFTPDDVRSIMSTNLEGLLRPQLAA